MNTALQIAVIIGSAREKRLADTVANWVGHELDRQPDTTWALVDPLELDLPLNMTDEAHPGVEALHARLKAADAVIVLTPEYNHSFSAALKHVIDYAFYEWQAKPIGFVSYGGRSGGIRAVEQLRPVFSELHAITVRDAVALPNVWSQFDDQGKLRDPEGPARTLGRMVSQLRWWARASRLAGAEAPYSEVA